MFDSRFFEDISLEQDLRKLADEIHDNREYRMIIAVYKAMTNTEPVPCEECKPGVDRLKCKKCYGYGYVLKENKEAAKSD